MICISREAFKHGAVSRLQCVIINKSDDKETVRSRVEDSAVDYWAVHVGGTKNNNKNFYTMIRWF